VGVVRKWVFPIIRILIFAAIAVALVKVAFFPDTTGANNPDVPSAQIVEPQVAVSIGTIQNDVSLSATISADAAVPIKATLAGEVRKVLIAAGSPVDVGTPILTLRAEVPSADGLSTSVKTTTVVSPVAGTLSSLTALVGQVFSVGDSVGQVAPPTFRASGSLAADQLYRLTVQPTEAQVVIAGGPAPFTCTGLTISTPLAGADGQEGDGGTAGPTVSCAIPVDVRVFPGLTATIIISGGAAENVLIVPITAVEGIAETGNVYAVLDDGSTELRPVTLGLNDGINVEITGGLEEGDLILQFVPGAAAVDPALNGGEIIGQDCVVNADGSEICTDVYK